MNSKIFTQRESRQTYTLPAVSFLLPGQERGDANSLLAPFPPGAAGPEPASLPGRSSESGISLVLTGLG